jgi:hypothetical protein
LILLDNFYFFGRFRRLFLCRVETHVARSISKHFQRIPLNAGWSTQHTRDMGDDRLDEDETRARLAEEMANWPEAARLEIERWREETALWMRIAARLAEQATQLRLDAGDMSARKLHTETWRSMLAAYVDAGLDLTKFPRTTVIKKLAKHFDIDPRTVERAIAEERKRLETKRRPS